MKAMYVDGNDVLYSKVPMYIGALLNLAKANSKIYNIVDIEDFNGMNKQQIVKFGVARKDYNFNDVIRKRKYKDYDLTSIYKKLCDVNDVEVSNIAKTLPLYYKRFNSIDIGVEDDHDIELVKLIKDSNKSPKMNYINRSDLFKTEYSLYILNRTETVIELIEAGVDLKGKTVLISSTGYNSHEGENGRLALNDNLLNLSTEHKFILSIVDAMMLNDITYG